MARTDNLTNFLTDVANAIREKTGETGTIYARDFDAKISSISGSSEPEITTRLPARYQEVEYIESIDYNNYIDTGVTFPGVKKVRYEFKVKMPDDIRNQAYWGCFMNGGYNGGTLYENRYYVAGDNTLNLALEANGIYEGYAYTDTNTQSGAFYANNGEINETLTYTTGGGLPDSDRAPFCIFCQGTPSGSGTYYNNGAKLRIYYFRIYLDDVIVRDFVPCYKKEYNSIGLYDLVNEIFYANQGTGTVTKGEDIIVEETYIQDGLVAWFDGEDALDEQGRWLSRIGDDYFYQSSGTSGKVSDLKTENAIVSDGTFSLVNVKDYLLTDYTFEIVGKAATGNSVDLFTFNKQQSVHVNIGRNGQDEFNVINGGLELQYYEKLYTGLVDKRCTFALNLFAVAPRGTINGHTRLFYSLNGDKWNTWGFSLDNRANGGAYMGNGNGYQGQNCCLLGYYSNQYPAAGEINCVRIYNRKLTDEELAHNHSIDQKRFNLDQYTEVSE